MEYLICAFFGFGALVLVGTFLLVRSAGRSRERYSAPEGNSLEDLLSRLEAAKAGTGGPERPLIYLFQHRVLPAEAFRNHPELIRSLTEVDSFMPLLHMWLKARMLCEDSGFLPEDSLDDESGHKEDFRLRSEIAIRPFRRNGYTVYVIGMPTPQFSPEAHYAAIVHKDDEGHDYGEASPSTRYFTLELSEVNITMFCEWTRDEAHLNFGEGPPPQVEAFAEAVFQRLAK